MKKLLCMLLAALLVVSMAALASAEGYKIAIMTGTTSQGEEEYYAATSLAEKYPDIVTPE